SAAITIHLESGPITREQYPFEFSVDFTYRVNANSLVIEQRYQNRSSRSMPFYAGFHPYYSAPEKSAVKLSLSAAQFDDFISGQSKAADEKERVINFDAAPETNGAYRNVNEKQVSFSNFGMPYSLELEFGEPYKHIVIWALKEKPFICVEPWMGLNNSLNTGES